MNFSATPSELPLRPVEELLDASSRWYEVAQVHEIPTPALLVFPQRVQENIRRMIQMAQDPKRLVPHVKTHKCSQVVQMQLAAGIRRFKAATVAEAEMTARCGPDEVILATQPVGPHVLRLAQLAQRYPQVQVSAVVDHPQVVEQLGQAAAKQEVRLGVYWDLDPGLGRTGVRTWQQVLQLQEALERQKCLHLRGVHVYDGQMGKLSPQQREPAVEQIWQWLTPLVARLQARAGKVEIVVGGSPSFPYHARREQALCSPGTTLYWDLNYGHRVPEVDFLLAAVLVTRVLSRPGPDVVTLDLGTKALCPDLPRRLELFPTLGTEMLLHNEEHLVLHMPQPCDWEPGQVVYAAPYHICPTVALHDEVWVVEGGQVQGRWPVEARRRRLEL